MLARISNENLGWAPRVINYRHIVKGFVKFLYALGEALLQISVSGFQA